MNNAVAYQTKWLCVTAMLAITMFTVACISTSYHKDRDAQRKATQLLVYMQGGLPALHARCIIETPDPTQVKDCIRIGTPNPGRSL